VHVGDNPEADIVGAASAGLVTVWMNSQQIEWPEKYQKPDKTIMSISELCGLLIPRIN
jgi:putative hydrolase of the HAD superfamily